MENGKIKESIAAFLEGKRRALALTLATNYRNGSSKCHMNRNLRQFCKNVDFALLGPRFYRPQASRRLLGFFVLESQGENSHFHALLRRPDSGLMSRMSNGPEAFFDHHWKAAVPSGTVKIEEAYDPLGWINYATKNAKNDYLYEGGVWSSDFWGA